MKSPIQIKIDHDDWWVYVVGPIDLGWGDLRIAFIEDLPEEVANAAKKLGWNCPAILCAHFFVPNPGTFDFEECFVWKHGNNGTCFIASKVPLPHLDE